MQCLLQGAAGWFIFVLLLEYLRRKTAPAAGVSCVRPRFGAHHSFVNESSAWSPRCHETLHRKFVAAKSFVTLASAVRFEF